MLRKLGIFGGKITASPTFNFSTDSCIVSFVFRKDVRLPQQLQRAMAAEAEATRDARAKVGLVTFNIRITRSKSH